MESSIKKILLFVFSLTFMCCHEAYAQVQFPKDFEQKKRAEYKALSKVEITLEQFLESEKRLFERQELQKKGKILKYVPRLSLSACGNGDFESGSINLMEWQGAYFEDPIEKCSYSNGNNYCPPNCQFPGGTPCVNVADFDDGIVSNQNINNPISHQTIVQAGIDLGGTPIQTVPPLPIVNNYSIRLGSRGLLSGSELISKTFIVTSANTNITFWYAAVFCDPIALPDPNNATRHIYEERPTFAVRVKNQSGTYFNNLVDLGNGSNKIISDRSNTSIFQYDPITPNQDADGKIIYKDWSCAKIDLSSMIGTTVTIEFLIQDCSWGGHWGYAYIDNFCGSPCPTVNSAGCCPNLVNILPSQPGPISGYSYDGTLPWLGSLTQGEYTSTNFAGANNICPNWNLCPSNGHMILINGKTAQIGKTTIWQRDVNVEAWKQYKFCAKFKNLPQCCLDVKPKIDILFSIAGNDILGEVIDESPADPCKWKEISKSLFITTGTGSMTIKILLDETGLGDGNDLAIDDIVLYELPQTSSQYSLLTISNTPLSNNKYSISAVANDPVPEPDCGYFWEICEVNLSTNDCIPSTKVSNPSSWWIGSATPNTFIGYIGTANLSGNFPGAFSVGNTYQVSLGTFCTCQGWNQTKYRFRYDPATGFTSWKL